MDELLQQPDQAKYKTTIIPNKDNIFLTNF